MAGMPKRRAGRRRNPGWSRGPGNQINHAGIPITELARVDRRGGQSGPWAISASSHDDLAIRIVALLNRYGA